MSLTISWTWTMTLGPRTLPTCGGRAERRILPRNLDMVCSRAAATCRMPRCLTQSLRRGHLQRRPTATATCLQLRNLAYGPSWIRRRPAALATACCRRERRRQLQWRREWRRCSARRVSIICPRTTRRARGTPVRWAAWVAARFPCPLCTACQPSCRQRRDWRRCRPAHPSRTRRRPRR